MARHFIPIGLLTAALGASLALAASGATTRFTVLPAKSRAIVSVGKSGALSFAAGHTHEVTAPVQSGVVDLDVAHPARSRVRLVFRASALKVSGKDEPPDDVPKVQEAMESEKVLDAAHHPTITFDSKSIEIGKRGDSATVLDLTVTGDVTVRGATAPVTAPVHVQLSANELTATGKLSVKQTSLGIKPISVSGVVAVKDTLEISFTVVATRSRMSH